MKLLLLMMLRLRLELLVLTDEGGGEGWRPINEDGGCGVYLSLVYAPERGLGLASRLLLVYQSH